MRPVSRIPPALPVTAMQTYQIAAPIQTHTRPATCAESGCGAYRNGFQVDADERTDLGQAQARYIRDVAGRRFVESRTEVGLTRFTFEAGQTCFAASTHRVALEREPVYVVRAGDWRGNPTGQRRVHQRAADWVDDFATHQNKIIERLERG